MSDNTKQEEAKVIAFNQPMTVSNIVINDVKYVTETERDSFALGFAKQFYAFVDDKSAKEFLEQYKATLK